MTKATLVTKLLLDIVGLDTADEHRLLDQRIMNEIGIIYEPN